MTFRYSSKLSRMSRVLIVGILLFSVEKQVLAQSAASFPESLSNFAPTLEKYQALVEPLGEKKKISPAESKQAS